MTDCPEHDVPRCEARKDQILEAAARCFARRGFHGTSIAQLAKASGMSPGHIYHFFENKESIIAALVERKLAQSLAMVSQFEDAEDVFQALIDRVDIGLSEKSNLDNAALELEILAEAARNPRVAASVRNADRIKRMRLLDVLGRASRERGSEREANTAETEIIMALFEGLAVRAVNHPEFDREALLPLLHKALRMFV